ncbi:MAG: type IV toxin-antitoxin system AbiEi family antitoxin domain-containing protein [Bacteroidota bacterium]|jgi:hypothetical protein|nr:type IV toxin-antitoxin system AbiEi family antitoxin domain-containing protein [Bacteroidota bacterium]
MSSKVKLLQKQAQATPILLSSWMEGNGVSRFDQSDMVRRHWLKRLANGVYHFDGFHPTLYAVLHSYIKLQNADYTLGASTALYLRGYYHYGYIGNLPVFLYSPTNKHIPAWIMRQEWNYQLNTFSTNIFRHSCIGVENITLEGFEVLASSLERAFMECLLLSPTHYDLIDLYYTMEMLTTLRPKVVQQLLEQCSSVKVKRLFLFMAEKANHKWVDAINLSQVDIGKGVRSFANKGVYNGKFKIVIPKELHEYE